MKKLFFDCGTRDPAASAGLFLLRAGTGLMMLIGHGIPKIQHFAMLKDHWTIPHIWPLSHMSEPISLMATISAEVLASAMIVFGLMTRPAAFVFGFAMVVAAFQVGGEAPWFLGTGVTAAKEPALLYLLPACVLILTGAGTWSFDAGIFKDKRRRYL
jgi:putative oxidoreductase